MPPRPRFPPFGGSATWFGVPRGHLRPEGPRNRRNPPSESSLQVMTEGIEAPGASRHESRPSRRCRTRGVGRHAGCVARRPRAATRPGARRLRTTAAPGLVLPAGHRDARSTSRPGAPRAARSAAPRRAAWIWPRTRAGGTGRRTRSAISPTTRTVNTWHGRCPLSSSGGPIRAISSAGAAINAPV